MLITEWGITCGPKHRAQTFVSTCLGGLVWCPHLSNKDVGDVVFLLALVLCDSFWDRNKVHLHSLKRLIGCLPCAWHRADARDPGFVGRQKVWPDAPHYTCQEVQVWHTVPVIVSALESCDAPQSLSIFFLSSSIWNLLLLLLSPSFSRGTLISETSLSLSVLSLFEVLLSTSQICIIHTPWLHACLYSTWLSFITSSSIEISCGSLGSSFCLGL